MIATHDPTESLLGVEDGVKPRAAPCIHLLGCPADQPQHLFGTDGNFRDVFSRVVLRRADVAARRLRGDRLRDHHRRRRSAPSPATVGGWTDNILMRLMDVILAFPSLLLAIAIVTALGPSLINALFAIGDRVDPDLCPRRARVGAVGQGAGLRDRVARPRRVDRSASCVRRIMPNSLTPLIVAGHARHRRRRARDRGARRSSASPATVARPSGAR